MDTLASGIIIVRNDPVSPDGPPSGWEVHELARIGARGAADESVMFERITGVDLDEDGNAYVLDRMAGVVRVFSPEGRHLRNIGARGRGPGEFRNPGGLALSVDGDVWVSDSGNDRYTRFRRDGSLVDMYPRARRFDLVGNEGLIWEDLVLGTHPSEQPSERLFRGVAPDSSGTMAAVDSIWRVIPEVDSWRMEVAVEPQTVIIRLEPVPFTPQYRDCKDPRGGFWAGITDELRFVHFGSSQDDSIRVVQRSPPPPTRVTAADTERAIQVITGMFGESGRAAARESLRADLRQVPPHMPYWSACVVDHGGRLWVERFRPPGASDADPWQWEVYDPDGIYLGALELPIRSSPRPSFRGNRVAGVTEDELGIQSVVVLEIRMK